MTIVAVLAAALAVADPHQAAAAAPSPERVLAHPEAVNPFAYADLIGWLWKKGRRQQATFWFYVFQERTRPWADADKDGSGAAALRAALNDELGTLVNGWVADDVAAWQAIVRRALSYEAHLPLAADRPDGLTLADWRARVARSRAEYTAAASQALLGLKPDAVAAGRRAAGLPVGPLSDAGPALPDDWR